MNLNFDNEKNIKREFYQKLRWFEEEFDSIFGNKTHNFTAKDIKLANLLLDKLSETINEYRDEKLLYPLVKILNNIEKKYPELFKE